VAAAAVAATLIEAALDAYIMISEQHKLRLGRLSFEFLSKS